MEVIEYGNRMMSYSAAVDKYLYIASQQDTQKDWKDSDYRDFYCEDVPFLLAFVHFLRERSLPENYRQKPV